MSVGDGALVLSPPAHCAVEQLDGWLQTRMPAWLLEALRTWPSYWPDETEAAFQRELEMRKRCKQQLKRFQVSSSDYTSGQLRHADRDGFHSASVLVTNQGRLLMLFVRDRKGIVKLTCTAGKRNCMEENAWSCACRETVEETGGVAELRSELDAASPTRVGWAANQKMAVFVHETARHDLAERIQELQRPPEGVHGVLPPEGVLTALWVPIDQLRDPAFLTHYSNHANGHIVRLVLPLINQREEEEAEALMEEEARLSETFARLYPSAADGVVSSPAMSNRAAGKQTAADAPSLEDEDEKYEDDSSDVDAPSHSCSHSTSGVTSGGALLVAPPSITLPPKWTARNAPSASDWRQDAAHKAKQERIRAKDQRMRKARDKRMH